jgi:hypothetical protein
VKHPKVIPGTPQPLDDTPLGLSEPTDSFLSRFMLLGKGICDEAPAHIAVHLIQDLTDAPAPYVHAHCHPSFDEIGLVIGQPGALEYEMVLDGEVHRVCAPACICIPAGTLHRARAVRGSGAYVCMLMDPRGPNASNTVKAGS